jgi:hypothetical protein
VWGSFVSGSLTERALLPFSLLYMCSQVSRLYMVLHMYTCIYIHTYVYVVYIYICMDIDMYVHVSACVHEDIYTERVGERVHLKVYKDR